MKMSAGATVFKVLLETEESNKMSAGMSPEFTPHVPLRIDVYVSS